MRTTLVVFLSLLIVCGCGEDGIQKSVPVEEPSPPSRPPQIFVADFNKGVEYRLILRLNDVLVIKAVNITLTFRFYETVFEPNGQPAARFKIGDREIIFKKRARIFFDINGIPTNKVGEEGFFLVEIKDVQVNRIELFILAI